MDAENNEKIERKNDDLDDDDVDIWEVNLDVGSLFKTVKVPERFAKFKLKSLTDLSDDKCLILKEPVDQKTPNKKDEKNKAERNPDEFEDDKDSKAKAGWRRGLDHSADEGAGEDEHDDPEQVVQP